MQLTTNLNLKKPEITDNVNIEDLNGNADILDAEVTKLASTTEAGRMSTADKTKLNGVAAGAQVNTVASVAGKTGAVTLAKADVGLGNVDNVQQAPISHVGSGGSAHAAATTSAAGFMSAADKTKLDGVAAGSQANRTIATQAQAEAGTDNATDMTPLRVAQSLAAASTAAATANTIVKRDASGRAKVAAPAANDDIARKAEVDAVATSNTTHANNTAAGVHGSTSAATASRLVIRDASGRAQFATPSASADAATKGYVDGVSIVTRTTANGSNANTFVTSGIYELSQPINGPVPLDWMYLHVIAHSSPGYVAQVAYDFFSNKSWTRRLEASVWSDWTEIGGGGSVSREVLFEEAASLPVGIISEIRTQSVDYTSKDGYIFVKRGYNTFYVNVYDSNANQLATIPFTDTGRGFQLHPSIQWLDSNTLGFVLYSSSSSYSGYAMMGTYKISTNQLSFSSQFQFSNNSETYVNMYGWYYANGKVFLCGWKSYGFNTYGDWNISTNVVSNVVRIDTGGARVNGITYHSGYYYIFTYDYVNKVTPANLQSFFGNSNSGWTARLTATIGQPSEAYVAGDGVLHLAGPANEAILLSNFTYLFYGSSLSSFNYRDASCNYNGKTVNIYVNHTSLGSSSDDIEYSITFSSYSTQSGTNLHPASITVKANLMFASLPILSWVKVENGKYYLVSLLTSGGSGSSMALQGRRAEITDYLNEVTL